MHFVFTIRMNKYDYFAIQQAEGHQSLFAVMLSHVFS